MSPDPCPEVVKYRIRVNRRGVFFVRFERSKANGHGVHIRPLFRWRRT